MLFDDLCRELIEERRLSKAEKTYLAAKNQLGHLLRTFAGRPVSALTRSSWTEHLIRAKRESARNLNDDRKYFLIAMNHAYSKGLITAPIVKIPKPDVEEEVGRELSTEEIERLLANATHSELRLMIETALRMGWRKEEMRKCRWDWVDLNHGFVRLPKKSVKTRKARLVPIPIDLLELFRERAKKRRGPYVFPSPFDVTRPIFIRKAWERTKKQAEVYCRWHDLRHTCATRMLRAGIHEVHISKILGMSTKVLRRIYEHLNVGDLKDAMDRVPWVGPLKTPQGTLTSFG